MKLPIHTQIQWLYYWNLRMDKKFRPTRYWVHAYFRILRFKLVKLGAQGMFKMVPSMKNTEDAMKCHQIVLHNYI